jgi:hypothetical protein
VTKSKAETQSESMPIHQEGAFSPSGGTLGFCSSCSSYFPKIQLVERVCGLSWAFACVLRKNGALIVMVPLGRPRGWRREGFGAGRAGWGSNRMGRQGMS